MEKDLQTLHQNCYDFLTSKNFHTAEKIGEFYLEVFEIAKQKCNNIGAACGTAAKEGNGTSNTNQRTSYRCGKNERQLGVFALRQAEKAAQNVGLCQLQEKRRSNRINNSRNQGFCRKALAKKDETKKEQ